MNVFSSFFKPFGTTSPQELTTVASLIISISKLPCIRFIQNHALSLSLSESRPSGTSLALHSPLPEVNSLDWHSTSSLCPPCLISLQSQCNVSPDFVCLSFYIPEDIFKVQLPEAGYSLDSYCLPGDPLFKMPLCLFPSMKVKYDPGQNKISYFQIS